MQATIEQLQAQLASEQKVSRGLKDALTTAGGGAALASQGGNVDYNALMQSPPEEQETMRP